MMQGHAHGTDS